VILQIAFKKHYRHERLEGESLPSSGGGENIRFRIKSKTFFSYDLPQASPAK